MVETNPTTVAQRFNWDSDVIYYPAGTDRCVICQEPHMSVVACYPDVGNPPEPLTVCLSCLSDHSEDWNRFGVTILENVELSYREFEPGLGAVADFHLPTEWRGAVYSPGYEPWERLSVEYDCYEVDVPASRSPWETKTTRSAEIDENSQRLHVDGNDYDYDGYAPVGIEAWQENVTESLNEPRHPEPERF